MIDRLRLTASAKNQLASLKKKTGIEHNNALCRHALCLSLANASVPPAERLNFAGGLEIDYRTFSGGQDANYINLVITRLMQDGQKVTEDAVRETFITHVHRGLSYLATRREDDLAVELAKALLVAWKPPLPGLLNQFA